jgi:2-polyprenyl-3-methyl-5-hydroxy-6-metoxy-1,4-benzoquinol methylase
MVHHSVCPLCSSEKIAFFLKCCDHFLTKEDFELWQCSACGFRFTQDYPGENSIAKYYESEDYISHSSAKRNISEKIYHMARGIMLRRKMVITETRTGLQKGVLLDIGSGTGHYAAQMKEEGWLVKAIEINEKARNFSINNFGLDVISPEKISELKDESFDCITLWHVLEHFHDPFMYGREIFRLLKPGGISIIALPNCGSIDAGNYGRFWAAYDVPRHLWHFNPASFSTFSEKAGFSLQEIISLPLDVFYISYLSQKYRGTPAPFIIGIIRALPWAIQSFFKREKSSSLIYILRKPDK